MNLKSTDRQYLLWSLIIGAFVVSVTAWLQWRIGGQYDAMVWRQQQAYVLGVP